LLEDWEKTATIAFKAANENIWLIGGNPEHLGQSLWLEVCQGRREGTPPSVNLVKERQSAALVRKLIEDGSVTAVHDVSDGGVVVAITEMALAGGLGAYVEIYPDDIGIAFGEDQGRYVVTAPPSVEIEGGQKIGRTNADGLLWGRTLADLRAAHEGFFPKLMGADAALA
jgi:phosphoribosylformylglycinamidine synthase